MLPQCSRTAFRTQTGTFKEAATNNNHTNLQTYTKTVTAYIKKCTDNVTVTKTICANQKPWLTAKVRGLLKTWDVAFRSGDKAVLKETTVNLSHGIKVAKQSCADTEKIQINQQSLHRQHTQSLLQAIQTITDYKPLPELCGDDTSLQYALNHFYAWVEMENDRLARKRATTPNDQVICLSSIDARKTLSSTKPRKAGDPDNIPGHELRDCAEQLTDVLTSLRLITTTGTKEVIHDLPEWLPSHSTEPDHEVLWEVSNASHQVQSP